jgi:hypothetical protein
MKIGDLIEFEGGERGIVLSIEMLYPGHPQSPPRNLDVRWIGMPPRYAFGAHRRKVSAFSVKKVLSRTVGNDSEAR